MQPVAGAAGARQGAERTGRRGGEGSDCVRGPMAQRMATKLIFDEGIPLYDGAPELFEEYQERARDVFYGRAGEGKQVSVAVNLLRLVALLVEPFMPSLAAKVYVQMGIERDAREETLLQALAEAPDFSVILGLVKPGMVVTNPQPIFRTISNDQVNSLKAKFGGKSN